MAEDDRDPLEELAADFLERQRAGQCPTIAEYVARRPDLAAEIEELFPTIAVLERLKLHKEEGSGGTLGAVRLERLGDFRILNEIGRGGMGIVFEAFQESLGRHVAVKVLPRQALLDPKQVRRFQHEAQTAARLHHTNIVPVFGVGESEGHHYIVMQLIAGVGLDRLLRSLRSGLECPTAGDSPSGVARLAQAVAEGSLWQAEPFASGFNIPSSSSDAPPTTDRPPEAVPPTDPPRIAQDATEEHASPPDPEKAIPPAGPAPAGKVQGNGGDSKLGPAYWRSVATIGRQVAEGLHYAHAHRTLHRDIKPANLLIDFQGSVWISDFGLAKAMEHDECTQTGGLAGTLRYMAPEQFTGQVDVRSDVYSLGLTLYELLTLRPAFEETGRSSLIRKIAHDEPPRPRSLNPRIPRDLETIVLKAMTRDPKDRYPTAGDLAADLTRFLEDRPILARRFSSLERLWRWARRNPAVASLTASTLILLTLVAAVATAGYVQIRAANIEIRAANTEQQRQRKRAEETTALALDALGNIFAQFAPDRSAPATALVVSGTANEQIAVPVQPVLSKEAAALLEHMLKFYDRLAEQESDDPGVQLKVAEAHRRVGDIRQRLGHLDASKAAYQKAIDLYGRLQESSPGKDVATEIARIHNELGTVHLAMQEPDQGLAEHRQALAVLSQAAGPDSPGRQFELARTYYYLGRRPDLGRHPPGEIRGERRGGPLPWQSAPLGIALAPPRPEFRWREAAPRRPDRDAPQRRPNALEDGEDSFERAYALVHRLRAEDTFDWPPRDRRGLDRPPHRGPWFEAKNENLARAIEILEQLVRASPDVPDYRHLLARCYRESPPVDDGGASGAARAAALLEKLVEDNPEVPDYRYDLCVTYLVLDLEEPDDASRGDNRHAMLARALAISEALVAEHPNIPDYAVSQVHIRLRMAAVLRNDPTQAEACLRKAIEVQAALIRRSPENAGYRFSAAVIGQSLADHLLEQNRLPEARTALREALTAFEEIVESSPRPELIRGLLARNYTNLAYIERRLGNADAADEALTHARGLK